MNRDDPAIKQRLQELCDRNGARLTPDAVLADASDPESPLHEHFEWDDSKAAAKHRLDQARSLIRSVKVVVRTTRMTLSAPYYVRDPSAAKGEQGYVAVTKLRTDQDAAREALVEEFSQVAHRLRRARVLAKSLELDGEVNALLEGVVDLRNRVTGETPALVS